MKRAATIGILTAAAVVACDAGEMEEAPEAAEPVAEQPTVAPDEPGAGEAATATLAVDTLQGVGAYLTDGQGRALYLLEGEPADSTTCYDACAREWPPFLATAGAPTAGAAPVQADLIGTIQRRPGQRQVTYAGHPLYYYHEDAGPGTATGQDVTDQWGEWYLVTPAGEHLEEGGS